MTKQEFIEDLNHLAYMDVLDCKDPQRPEDKEYMDAYHFWRPLQHFPGDEHY